MTLWNGGKPWLTSAARIKKGAPVTPTKLPINAVILQRNRSGQDQTTHYSPEQHHSRRRLTTARYQLKQHQNKPFSGKKKPSQTIDLNVASTIVRRLKQAKSPTPAEPASKQSSKKSELWIGQKTKASAQQPDQAATRAWVEQERTQPSFRSTS